MYRINKSKLLLSMLLGCVASLLFAETVFAEGEVPVTVPQEDVPAEEPATELVFEQSVKIQTGEEAPPNEEIVAEENIELMTTVVPQENACPEQREMVQNPMEITTSADPWWKVGTITYMTEFPGGCPDGTLGSTCWESTTPINEALYRIFLLGSLPTDRKLYVKAGTYTDTINIDTTGTVLAQLNGIIGEPSVEGFYDSKITGNMYWYGASNGFTLSGFEFTGNVYFADNNGTLTLKDLYIHDTSLGLRVNDQNGAIKLNQIRIEDNDNHGALLRNNIHPYAGVEVINSSFNYNTALSDNLHGLEIDTNGAVTVNGVSSSYNHGDGLNIEGAKSVTIKNSVFSYNDDLVDTGSIGWGVNIDTDKNGSVLLEHVYTVGNEGYGIDIKTWGKVTLNNVISTDNGRGGAWVDNCYMNGGFCENTSSIPVVVNDSKFDSNASQNGLTIYSKGTVTLNSIHSYNNHGYGVFINTCFYYNGACQGYGAVKVGSKNSTGIGGVNYFGWNGVDGLYIDSSGNVNVSNFAAEKNGSNGVYIYNAHPLSNASVIIKSTLKEWENLIKQNTVKGLDIDSNGTITVDKLYSFNNGATGVELDNDHIGVAKGIVISNVRSDWNESTGIHADSYASVTIINSTASYNSSMGLDIDNSGGSGNVVIRSTSKYDQYSFDGNRESHGILILTNGSVKVGNVSASLNALDGIHIGDAGTSIYPKTTTITNSRFESNSLMGANIETMGNIILNSIVANSNGSNGAYLENCQPDAGVCQYNATITISGIDNEFSSNGGYGLSANAKGNISLTNIVAGNNDFQGLYLKNSSTGATGSVTLKTSSMRLRNLLYNNGNDGFFSNLYVSSNGAVTVQNTDTVFSTAFGICLENHLAGTNKTVKIIRSTAINNQSDGIFLNTNSNVLIQDTSSNSNGGWGLSVVTNGSVTVTCTSPLGTCTFNDNDTGDGLYIQALKSITINKIVANDNGDGSGDHGMELNNFTNASDPFADPIKITNVSVEGNHDCGILATTKSNVTLSSVLARDNYVGVSIGLNTDAVNNVIVRGINLFEKNGEGLRVYANGLVSISNVTAEGQLSGSGLLVYGNTEGNALNIKNIVARFNHYGIYISSQGSVNLHSVISMSNGTSTYDGDGIYVYMPDEEDMLTIRNSVFIFNAGSGIQAEIFDATTYTNIKLINTYYMGNDSNNLNNDQDLYIY